MVLFSLFLGEPGAAPGQSGPGKSDRTLKPQHGAGQVSMKLKLCPELLQVSQKLCKKETVDAMVKH